MVYSKVGKCSSGGVEMILCLTKDTEAIVGDDLFLLLLFFFLFLIVQVAALATQ